MQTIKIIRYVQADPPGILWEEPMIFSKLFAPNDEICEKGAWFKVTKVEVEDSVQVVTLVPIPVAPANQPSLW